MGKFGLVVLVAAVAWFLQPSPLSDTILPVTSTHTQPSLASAPVVSSVPPSVPLGITLPALEVRAELYPEGIDTDAAGRLDPVDDRPVWWVRTAMPTTRSGGGATMILGHNLGDGSTPFSRLAELKAGDDVTVWTQGGEIRYEVQEVVSIGRRNLPDDDRLMADVPGRLLLVTCRTDDGAATTDNVVVVAQLQ